MSANGVEFGLHGSRKSHNDPAQLRQEKEALAAVTDDPVLGVRQHYHQLDKVPTKTFEAQAAAGFVYDSTFVPQSFGLERIFQPFEAVTSMTEIPVSFADRDYGSLVREYDVETVWNRIEAVLEQYRRNDGVCCVSWHPHAFYDDENLAHRLFYNHFEGFSELYERILEYGAEYGARMCPCRDVVDRQRDKTARW